MINRYILKDGVPVLEPDLLKWAKWLEQVENRSVALTEVGDVEVSTVFFGLDYNFFGREQILFETMIFRNGKPEDYRERYSTLEEAMIGHERAVAMVKGSAPPAWADRQAEDDSK